MGVIFGQTRKTRYNFTMKLGVFIIQITIIYTNFNFKKQKKIKCIITGGGLKKVSLGSCVSSPCYS